MTHTRHTHPLIPDFDSLGSSGAVSEANLNRWRGTRWTFYLDFYPYAIVHDYRELTAKYE
jgi:hypothetical protein